MPTALRYSPRDDHCLLAVRDGRVLGEADVATLGVGLAPSGLARARGHVRAVVRADAGELCVAAEQRAVRRVDQRFGAPNVSACRVINDEVAVVLQANHRAR